MPQKRKDAEYLRQRIAELYGNHTAKEIADILNNDDQVLAPVTERVVWNNINKSRKQHNGVNELPATYKDRPWTGEDDATLQEMYATGSSIPLIAERLGRSAPSIHARIRTLKLANRKITPEQEQVVRDLLQHTHKSLKEIAYELALKYQAVRHVSNKVKAEHGVSQRHTSDISLLEDGSLFERLLRTAFINKYGDAVVPWQRNREWSQGRGWQIDIPIEFPSGLKVAVEVNHVRTHADRRNRDYAKRHLAEELGWVWVPIWFQEELTKEVLEEAFTTLTRIIDGFLEGHPDYYYTYIADVEQLEKGYYHTEQPPYDPKAGIEFGNPWNREDENIVRENYGKIPMKQVQNMLSTSRTTDAIKHKAGQLGITNGRKSNFSPTEDDIIRKMYEDASKEEILAELPGRSWSSIASRAGRLGVLRRDVWTTKEDDKLRLVFPDEPRSVIQSALPHRSWLAITSRASRLGLRRSKPF